MSYGIFDTKEEFDAWMEDAAVQRAKLAGLERKVDLAIADTVGKGVAASGVTRLLPDEVMGVVRGLKRGASFIPLLPVALLPGPIGDALKEIGAGIEVLAEYLGIE